MAKFQSTPPRGGRLENVSIQVSELVSIHAPARGATANVIYEEYKAVVSIHAPARGATYAT